MIGGVTQVDWRKDDHANTYFYVNVEKASGEKDVQFFHNFVSLVLEVEFPFQWSIAGAAGLGRQPLSTIKLIPLSQMKVEEAQPIVVRLACGQELEIFERQNHDACDYPLRS